MKVRHVDENSPSTYRGNGVRTSPGDVVEVDTSVGERLIRKSYFELVEDDDEVSAWAKALADEHWQTVVSEVESGKVDDLLDDLEKIDGRTSVQSAIEERRTELEA